MKNVTLVLFMMMSVVQAQTATLICSGHGLSLQLTVQNSVTKNEVVEAVLNDGQKIEMSVLTQVLKPGQYYRDNEVRIYQGYSKDRSLDVGFLVSQVLDQNQNEVRFDVNKFGQAQVELGKCEVR